MVLMAAERRLERSAVDYCGEGLEWISIGKWVRMELVSRGLFWVEGCGRNKMGEGQEKLSIKGKRPERSRFPNFFPTSLLRSAWTLACAKASIARCRNRPRTPLTMHSYRFTRSCIETLTLGF